MERYRFTNKYLQLSPEELNANLRQAETEIRNGMGQLALPLIIAVQIALSARPNWNSLTDGQISAEDILFASVAVSGLVLGIAKSVPRASRQIRSGIQMRNEVLEATSIRGLSTEGVLFKRVETIPQMANIL